MKKIKVILSVLLMAAAISFTACSNASSGSDSDKTEKEDDKKTETPKPASGNGSGSGSGSGGGNQTPAVTYIGSKAPTVAKAVGDIVFTDGSATPYHMVNSLTAEKKQAAIAIIFYVGTDLNNEGDTTTVRTLGLGLKHDKTGRAWCSYTANGYNKSIEAIFSSGSPDAEGNVTITGDKNGFDNLAQIGAYLATNDDTDTPENYPALYFAKDYKNVTGSQVSGTVYENGWYLPSLGELYYIYLKGKSATKVFDIDAALQALGGDKFESDDYMSSSLITAGSVNVFSFERAEVKNYAIGPIGSFPVCAIRDFTTYTVTVNAAEHGTVTANKTSAQAGDSITLTGTGTSTESYEYKVSSFTVNGNNKNPDSNNTYTFTMPAANVTVSVNFISVPYYSIILSPCTGGTVTANKTRAIEGDTVTLTVTPTSNEESDYRFKSLTMNGTTLTVSSNNTTTFTMPAANATVSAEFESIYIGTKKPTAAKAVGDIVFNDGSAMPYTTFNNLDSTVKDTKKTSAIALIFYKGNGLNSGNDTSTRTLGLGLKGRSSSYNWCDSAANGNSISIDTILCSYSGYNAETYNFTGDKNGKDNFEAIGTYLVSHNSTDDTARTTATASNTKYHAFEFAEHYSSTATNLGNFNTGWYLPSIAELFQIWKCRQDTTNGFAIDDVLDALGGDQLLEITFWSSSQHPSQPTWAYKLSFYNGRLNTDSSPKSTITGVRCIREF